jgi:hypothetical protein
VLYRDDELSSNVRQTIEAHLNECVGCRSDYELIRNALLEVQRECDAPKPTAMWEGVQAKIRQWKAAQSQAELGAAAVRGRVTRQAGLFLGDLAAHRVLQPASPDNHDLLSILEPVLADFLGSGAAAALMHRVVDTAIVKI